MDLSSVRRAVVTGGAGFVGSWVLGWEPRTSVEEGLKRTLEWFAAQHADGSTAA